MTRYKEYIRSKGFRLENDYEYLPYTMSDNVSVLYVICKLDVVPKLTIVTDVDVTTVCFYKNGEVKEEQDEVLY